MAKNTGLAKFVDCFGPDSVFAIGNFTTAGTGAVVQNELQGIVSITRTGVGTFDVVFARGWKSINITFGLLHTTQAATPVVSAVNAATRTVTVKMLAVSTATETTGAVIYIQALLRKSV